ncbi:MAG: 16S rRNA (guanine1207-N2)-methyltransferase [Polyangiales bacterium]|jgi:16S rRNA (guanine1207-N2)-methyltransferase
MGEGPSAPTQLALQVDGFTEGALIIGAPPADFEYLSGASRFFSFLQQPGAECGLAPALGEEPRVLLYLPKGKRRRDYAFALAAERLAQTGTLAVVGERNGGIKAARKALRRYFKDVHVRSVGNHCQLLTAHGALSGAVDMSEWRSQSRLELGFDIYGYPGTFSEGRLDEGTQRLLQVLELPAQGKLLDLASGCGVIGVWAKKKQPGLAVTLSDIDHLSIAASKETAAGAEAEVECIAADGIPAGRTFDVIVTNPPFHQGVQTEYETTERFLSDVPKALNPGGRFWLVANNFLPYEGWLKDNFADRVAKRFEDKRFKVYEAWAP